MFYRKVNPRTICKLLYLFVVIPISNLVSFSETPIESFSVSRHNWHNTKYVFFFAIKFINHTDCNFTKFKQNMLQRVGNIIALSLRIKIKLSS